MQCHAAAAKFVDEVDHHHSVLDGDAEDRNESDQRRTLNGKPEKKEKRGTAHQRYRNIKDDRRGISKPPETGIDQNKHKHQAIGIAIASLRPACCAFSNWPPHVMKYPGGILTLWLTAASHPQQNCLCPYR